MRILSVSEMHALESTANIAGHTYDQMMELAGQAVARAILSRVPVKGRRILVLVGPGNNGGDGLVAAGFLSEAGANVTAYLARDRDPEEDDVFRQAKERGVTMITAPEDAKHDSLRRRVAQAHILVDALLGTGAQPPIRGTIAEILRAVQESLDRAPRSPLTTLNRVIDPPPTRPFIVAVDGPSGLDFDSGETGDLTLDAHVTVTFAAPKWGHFRLPGAAKAGELVVADIGIPKNISIPGEGPEVVTPEMVQAWIPERPLDAHKGTFGKALIVAGSSNYTGAAILSATAAIRAGTGLVTMAIPSSLHEAIVPAVPEATYLLLSHSLGVLNARAIPLASERIKEYDAILIGPGLSTTAESTAFLRGLFGLHSSKRGPGFLERQSETEKATSVEFPPLVIDADGLNILSETPGGVESLPPETILTPHPGEMARLTGGEVAEIQANRLKVTAEKSEEWGHVVVLKGAFTVVAAPGGRTVLVPFANPALSSAGTGDVLAGTIVALRAQGLGAFEAAVAGTYVHGLAGELARRKLGVAGVTAGDVARALPEALYCLMR